MKPADNMPPPPAKRRPSEEINIFQTPLKSPEATESIFHRQEVIKSLDPALPAFEAAASPVSEQRDGMMPSENRSQVDLGHCTNLTGMGETWLHCVDHSFIYLFPLQPP